MVAPATTLENARADVRGYIDDRNRRRWSDDQVDRALHSSITSCIDTHATAGGDQFIDEVEVTSSAEDGTASLLAHDPVTIRAVIVTNTPDAFTWPLQPCDPAVRGTIDKTARNLVVRLVKRPPLPTEKTDPLIGARDGVVRSWLAFDKWVCMCAALELGITDDDQRVTLEKAEARRRSEILTIKRIPATLPWPRERRRWLWETRWLWLPRTATLQLRLSGSRGF